MLDLKVALLLAAMTMVVTSLDTLTSVLKQNSRLITFNKLMEASHLLSKLQSSPITVLAPTDKALNVLGATRLSELLGDREKARDFVKSFLVEGVALSPNRNTSMVAKDGSTAWVIHYPTRNMTLMNGKVVDTHQEIRISQGVILPFDDFVQFGKQSAYDFLVAQPNFTNFLTAVQLAGKIDDLKAPGITVFAPNDQAFTDLGETHTTGFFNRIPLLREFVSQHIVKGVFYFEALVPDITLHAQDSHHLKLHILAHSGRTTFFRMRDGLQRRVTSFQPDVPVTNGVVHVVSNVVLSREQYKATSSLFG